MIVFQLAFLYALEMTWLSITENLHKTQPSPIPEHGNHEAFSLYLKYCIKTSFILIHVHFNLFMLTNTTKSTKYCEHFWITKTQTAQALSVKSRRVNTSDWYASTWNMGSCNKLPQIARRTLCGVHHFYQRVPKHSFNQNLAPSGLVRPRAIYGLLWLFMASSVSKFHCGSTRAREVAKYLEG